MSRAKRVALVFDDSPRPVLLSITGTEADFRRKCDEACARLFGSTAYCVSLELEPFGELIPESFDAIRDGDKIVARVAHRSDTSAADDAESTVLSPDDWKAMRESNINQGSAFQQLVKRFAPEQERRRSRSLGDEDDAAASASEPQGPATSGVRRRGPQPQPPLRTASNGSAAPVLRKPTRPVAALAALATSVDDSDDFESAPSESDQHPRESLRTISAKLEDIDEEMARINAELAKASAPAPMVKAASARPATNSRPVTRVVPQSDLDLVRTASNGRPLSRAPTNDMDQLDAFLGFGSAPSSNARALDRTVSKGQFTTSSPAPLGPSSPLISGPPPKPQKSEQALIRAEQLKRGRSNAQAIDVPRALSPQRSGPASPSGAASPALQRQVSNANVRTLSPSRADQRSLSPSRNASNSNSNSGRFASAGAVPGGRAYANSGAGGGAAAQLPHMPSRQPLFDGLPAPILTPSLATVVTKTSGPFACPVCFKSYPIAADVFHHVQKRHEVELLDAAAVNDANESYHSHPALQRQMSVNGSGQAFGAAAFSGGGGGGQRSANSGGALDSGSGSGGMIDQPLPPGWTRVWSKSKQKFYFFNERTGASIWTLAGVFAAK